MSRPHESDIRGAFLRTAAAALLAVGTALPLVRAVFPFQVLWPAMLWCAGLSAALGILYELPFGHKKILSFALLAGLVLWGALGGGPAYTAAQLGKAVFLSLRGVSDAALPYADAGRVSLCLLFSLFGVILVWVDSPSLAAFCVIAAATFSCLLSGEGEPVLYALPGFAGALILLCGKENRRLSVLPLAALLTTAAFLLLPAQGQTSPPLQELATRIHEWVEDYLFFNDYRASFSLSTEGFQPLRERLGGPAMPDDHTVMEVETDRMLLLRGRTYNDYSGLNWYDTLSARRYLYQSPRYTALRDDLLDIARPQAENIPEARTVRIHMLSGGTTTLFAPTHLRSIQMGGERMVLYFNLAGELFITRDLAAGDSYVLSYLPLTPESAATEALIAACAALPDPHYQEICEDYLALPSHIQQEVFDIAALATSGAETPYEKALALETYLRGHYRYNMNVPNPPENVDFVAWFLLGQQEGYCTYFASAMTVLCRAVGVPARYVTGYLAVPDENGRAMVTGREAHAWTEVYLNGLGWLAFDATPRTDNERPGDDPNENGVPPSQPTPTPTPTPTPSPTPAPENQATPTPPPPEGDAPTPTPDSPNAATPTPPGAPSPSPDPANPPPPDREQEGGRFPWWIVPLILFLCVLIVWRYLWTEPVRRAARKPDRAGEIYYLAICSLLGAKKLRRQPAETLAAFAERIGPGLDDAAAPLVRRALHAYAAQVYGKRPADHKLMERAYHALQKTVSPLRRFLLALRRMLGLREAG